MQPTRIVAISSASALLAVWLAAAAGMRTPAALPDAPITPQPAAVDRVVADMGAQARQLHERLRLAPVPQRPSRNPFRFDSAPPRRDRAVRTAVAPPVPAAAVAVAPRPSFALIGIAENQAGDALVRTAIISGEGQLFMVAVGEGVTERFRVSAIGADAVELTDLTGDTPLRLALR